MSEEIPDYQAKERAGWEQRIQNARDLAGCYARTFSTDDGKRVLADLRAKFGVDQPVFILQRDRYDALAAALKEGERHVLSDIEKALKLGAPLQLPK